MMKAGYSSYSTDRRVSRAILNPPARNSVRQRCILKMKAEIIKFKVNHGVRSRCRLEKVQLEATSSFGSNLFAQVLRESCLVTNVLYDESTCLELLS